MHFGITNGTAIFQRAMNKVLTGLLGKCCMVYVDDILVYFKTVEQYAEHLKAVFQGLHNAGWYRVFSPQQYKQQVIDRCHQEVTHAAPTKMLACVQENYIWPSCRVCEYLQVCVHCTITPPNPAHPR